MTFDTCINLWNHHHSQETFEEPSQQDQPHSRFLNPLVNHSKQYFQVLIIFQVLFRVLGTIFCYHRNWTTFYHRWNRLMIMSAFLWHNQSTGHLERQDTWMPLDLGNGGPRLQRAPKQLSFIAVFLN